MEQQQTLIMLEEDVIIATSAGFGYVMGYDTSKSYLSFISLECKTIPI